MDKTQLEQLLRLSELDRKIREGGISLPEQKPLERLLEDLKKTGKVKRDGRIDGRAEAGKARRKKNAARKLRNARQARWRRGWRERQLTAAMLEQEWYNYLRRRWIDRGWGWDIPKEQWDLHVKPLIPEGAVLSVQRYDTKQKTRLENIMVYTSTGEPVFDGKEWKLKAMGYIL